MYEQHPQVDVALFADRSQPTPVSARTLPRGESQITGKVATGSKSSGVTDKSVLQQRKGRLRMS